MFLLIRVSMYDMHVGSVHYDSLLYLQIDITLNSIQSSVGWSVTDRESAIDHWGMSNTSTPICRRQGLLVLPLLQFYPEHISPPFRMYILYKMSIRNDSKPWFFQELKKNECQTISVHITNLAVVFHDNLYGKI